METLRDKIKTFVTATWSQRSEFAQKLEADRLENSVTVYLASDGALCVRACAASQIGAPLPTKISASAAATLAALRELVDCGLVTGLQLHEQGGGVTLEVTNG